MLKLSYRRREIHPFSPWSVPCQNARPRLKAGCDTRDKTGFIRSRKVMEFENAFSRPGKVINFRKNGQGHGKTMEFHFLVQIFCTACLKIENIHLVIEQKYAPKRLGF